MLRSSREKRLTAALRTPKLTAMLIFDRISVPLQQALASALRRLAQLAHTSSWDQWASQRLTPTQRKILELLASRRESLTLSAVAQELGVTPATASDSLTALETKGLVKKRRSHVDGRALAIMLTTEGRRSVTALAALPDPLQAAFSVLSPRRAGNLLSIGDQDDPRAAGKRHAADFTHVCAVPVFRSVPLSGLRDAPSLSPGRRAVRGPASAHRLPGSGIQRARGAGSAVGALLRAAGRRKKTTERSEAASRERFFQRSFFANLSAQQVWFGFGKLSDSSSPSRDGEAGEILLHDDAQLCIRRRELSAGERHFVRLAPARRGALGQTHFHCPTRIARSDRPAAAGSRGADTRDSAPPPKRTRSSTAPRCASSRTSPCVSRSRSESPLILSFMPYRFRSAREFEHALSQHQMRTIQHPCHRGW